MAIAGCAEVRVAAIGALLLALASCSGPPSATNGAPDAPAAVKGETRVEATVRLRDVEGGCWVLETASDTLLPLNLEPALKVEGLAVEAWIRDAPNMMTTCQVGRPVEVVRAARR